MRSEERGAAWRHFEAAEVLYLLHTCMHASRACSFRSWASCSGCLLERCRRDKRSNAGGSWFEQVEVVGCGGQALCRAIEKSRSWGSEIVPVEDVDVTNRLPEGGYHVPGGALRVHPHAVAWRFGRKSSNIRWIVCLSFCQRIQSYVQTALALSSHALLFEKRIMTLYQPPR